MPTCIDPPSKRDPRNKLGSHELTGESVEVPQGNSAVIVAETAFKVKPDLQQGVDKWSKAATYGGKEPVDSAGIREDQRALLNRFGARNHPYALLLALHGELREEHLEDDSSDPYVVSTWEAEAMRRVRMMERKGKLS